MQTKIVLRYSFFTLQISIDESPIDVARTKTTPAGLVGISIYASI